MNRPPVALMDAALNAVLGAMMVALGAGLMLGLAWGLLQPDPIQQARGAEAHAALLERLEADEQQCVDEALAHVWATRQATDAELAEAHGWCDRTSAWR